MTKLEFTVKGMRCAGCAANLQKKISGLDGVRNCSVNIATNTMSLEADDPKVSVADIIAAVGSAGFQAALVTKPSEAYVEASEETVSYFLRFLLAGIFSVLLSWAAMYRMLHIPWFPVSDKGNAVIQIILLLPILYAGFGFYRNGFPALLKFRPNMDSLIALSTSCAVIYSIVLLCSGEFLHLYFDTAGMIVFLIMLGKLLEARSKGKASGAIRELMKLTPDTAELVRPDGKSVTVQAETLKPGDVIRLSPGSRIPVDGTVTEGNGTADESMLTGESMPVEKKPGDRVTGGSIVLNGSFLFEADRTGAETTLAHIIEMVRKAQSTKPKISRLADLISGYFVWGVILIAALTFCIWFFAAGEPFGKSLGFSLAVLVIACPCALGLATPAAVIAGIGRGAKLGILIRGGEAIETAGKISTAIFDKTGTLTEGKPSVREFIPAPDGTLSKDELIRLCAAAAGGSSHPLSAATGEFGDPNGEHTVRTDDFKEIPGMGIEAEISGKKILLGNGSLMEKNHVSMEKLTIPEGKSFVCAAVNGKAEGVFLFEDRIRPEAEETIRKLSEMKIHSVVLSGDAPSAVRSVAEKLGIHLCFGGLLPQEKLNTITDFRKRGNVTAMIGDGINDAPALAASDLGIGLSSGTNIAMESAQIVLMRPDLKGVPAAVGLSRAVMRTIRQNLFWAFLYNIICIPLAAGVFYPWFHWQLHPAAGAAAMAFSSVTVVCNALRLFRWKPE